MFHCLIQNEKRQSWPFNEQFAGSGVKRFGNSTVDWSSVLEAPLARCVRPSIENNVVQAFADGEIFSGHFNIF